MNNQNNVSRCGTDIEIVNNAGILENSAIFTMKAENDSASITLSIGYSTAKQENDISHGEVIIYSKIIDDIDKPGIQYSVNENNIICFNLINMKPEYFSNISKDTNKNTYIFTTRKHIANFNNKTAVIAEFIIQLIEDLNNTLVVTINIYTKSNPST